jgi:hypothetical protein
MEQWVGAGGTPRARVTGVATPSQRLVCQQMPNSGASIDRICGNVVRAHDYPIRG